MYFTIFKSERWLLFNAKGAFFSSIMARTSNITFLQDYVLFVLDQHA